MNHVQHVNYADAYGNPGVVDVDKKLILNYMSFIQRNIDATVAKTSALSIDEFKIYQHAQINLDNFEADTFQYIHEPDTPPCRRMRIACWLKWLSEANKSIDALLDEVDKRAGWKSE